MAPVPERLIGCLCVCYCVCSQRMAEALFARNRNEQRIAPCALPGGSHGCVRDRHVSVRVFARFNAPTHVVACLRAKSARASPGTLAGLSQCGTERSRYSRGTPRYSHGTLGVPPRYSHRTLKWRFRGFNALTGGAYSGSTLWVLSGGPLRTSRTTEMTSPGTSSDESTLAHARLSGWLPR